MTKYLLLLLLLTGLSLRVAQSPLEGSWTASGPTGDEALGWTLTYGFDGNDYTLEGYPPLNEKGTYSVILQEEYATTVLLEPEEGQDRLVKFTLLEDGTLFMNDYSTTGGITFSAIHE